MNIEGISHHSLLTILSLNLLGTTILDTPVKSLRGRHSR